MSAAKQYPNPQTKVQILWICVNLGLPDSGKKQNLKSNPNPQTKQPLSIQKYYNQVSRNTTIKA